jgi:hypothetical protein
MLRRTAFISDRHIGTSFSDRRQVRRRAIEGSSVPATKTRTETPQPTPSTYLTAVGLVAVTVIIIFFGLATLQLFNGTKNTSGSFGLYVIRGARPPEVSGERPPSRPLLINGGVRTMNNAALDRAVPTISTPADEREQLFRAFETYRSGGAGWRSPHGDQAKASSPVTSLGN